MAQRLPMRSSRKIDVAPGDRLSSLPDELIHSIMSFLPVRHAVQTCVLSRRWEHLWCSMPCLNIDQQEFDLTVSGDKKSDRFEEFVNNLLMFHRASSLDMFRFHVTHTYDSKVVQRWIRRGMKCCPAVVELYRASSAHRFYGLPHLGSNACRLKKLHLVAIALDKSFTQLLPSGCPLLEDLKFDRCSFDSPEITSCTLKNLIVDDCTTYFGKVLTVTAPDLVSFYLVINVECNWGGILVNEMPFVANSTICLNHNSRLKVHRRNPCKLLSSITNVKKLELSGPQTSILHEGSDTFPTFPNLRSLLFDGCDLSDDFQLLGHFLNNAPSLEKLSLQYCKLPEGSKKRKKTEHPKRISIKCQEALTFQCPNLKLTEIKHKEDDVHQLFGLLSGIWRNLLKTTIVLTKA